MKLCELKSINKNPKYKVVVYESEYYLIDLTSNWLSYIFPMINWFIPKKCIRMSHEGVQKLSILKPIKNNKIGFVSGSGVLLSVILRNYIDLLNFQAEKILVIISCFLAAISILFFFIYLNRKLKLNFSKEKSTSKILLVPTFKSILILFYFWLLFGLFAVISFWMLVIDDIQNIIAFICLILATILFLCSNMVSFNDTKVRAKLITKEIEK